MLYFLQDFSFQFSLPQLSSPIQNQTYGNHFMNPRSLLTALSILLLPFFSVSAAVPGNWVAGDYSAGDLVIYEGTTYIATQTVAASLGVPTTATSYWSSLDVVAGSKSTPTGQPASTPDTSGLSGLDVPSDTNGTTALTGGRLINLSTRGFVGSGAKRLIGGFRVYGGDLKVLVRGFGPSRPNEDNLNDPILTWKTNPTSLLPDTSGIVSETDDASGNSRLSGVSSSTQELLDVLISKETADIQTVSNFDNNNSKGYTAFITNVSGTDEGIGRIGINDLSDQTGNGQLVNISTRGYVGSASKEYLIAGFQIRGGSVKVCMRAFGPSRSNADALSDPMIELIQQVSTFHSTKTTLAKNDDWQSDYNDGTTVTANSSANVPTYLSTLIQKESAIVVTLPEGDYTAKVSGVGGVSGIGRVGIDKVIE